MKKRKLLTIVSALFVCGVIAAGCGKSSQDNGSAGTEESTEASAEAAGSDEKTLTPVTIYGVTDPQEAAQIIIAKEKGFFEEEGLDVTNVLIESSSDIPAYIVSGEAPVSAESEVACIEVAAQGVGLKTLMTTSNICNNQGFIIGPNTEIQSAKDLEGKTLGIMSGAGFMRAIQNMCADMGVDIEKMEIVYLSPAEQVAALENGSIDMMACWEPYMSQAIDMGGTLLFTGIQSYFPEYTEEVDWMNFYSTFEVTEEYYEENYDTCVSLVKAIVKATDYINENLDECAGIIAANLNNDKDAIYAIMSSNVYVTMFDQTFADALNDMAQYMYEAGNISEVPDFDTYCDPTILKEVAPEKVTYSK